MGRRLACGWIGRCCYRIWDTDSDGDLDQMGMYFVDRRNGLRVWWFIDDGDDNLLGYDVDYYYYQIPCQDQTHFGKRA